ncbi:hypothetical protein ACLBWS_16375 [Brucellaceae bacterium D45D]
MKKQFDCLFNESEKAANEDESGTDNFIDPPNTDLPAEKGQTRKKCPLPEYLPLEHIAYDLADDQKSYQCCQGRMHPVTSQ